MPLYVVEFGSIKCAEGDIRKVGDVIELDAADPLVMNKHQVMAVDKDFQPVPVYPEQYVTQVKAAPAGAKPHPADILMAAKKAAELKAAEMLSKPLETAAAAAVPTPVRTTQPGTGPSR